MKYILAIILFSILVFNNCFGQKSDSLFTIFKKNKELQQGSKITNDRLNDEMKVLYYTILDNSNLRTIEMLTNDSNPAIRALMYIGLAQKNAPHSILERIYFKHKNDTSTFESGSGCVVTNYRVNEWMKMTLNWIRKGKLRKIDFKSEIDKIKNKIKLEPRILIPGLEFNKIKRSAFLKVDKLDFSLPSWKVVSFALTDGVVGLHKSQSENITSGMKRIIRMTKTNKIFIEDINVISPDNEIRKMPSLIIEIQ